MSAPGLDIQLVEMLGLNENVSRTSVNFMGCYAAFHALKMADFICKNEPESNVLIVCVELCTLHFQKKAAVDNFLSNALFADGAAAVLISGDNKKKYNGLKVHNFYSALETGGKSLMGWNISSSGFLMTLNPEVPDLVEMGLKKMRVELPHFLFNGMADYIHWAIHPGGKKILEASANAFE